MVFTYSLPAPSWWFGKERRNTLYYDVEVVWKVFLFSFCQLENLIYKKKNHKSLKIIQLIERKEKKHKNTNLELWRFESSLLLKASHGHLSFQHSSKFFSPLLFPFVLLCTKHRNMIIFRQWAGALIQRSHCCQEKYDLLFVSLIWTGLSKDEFFSKCRPWPPLKTEGYLFIRLCA